MPSILSTAISINAAASEETTTTSNDNDNNFALAAYLPDYRVHAFVEQQLQSNDPPPPLVTDLILFSLQPHSKGFLGGCCLQPDHYEAIAKYRAEIHPSVKLWVTIGGAGRGDAFPEIFKDEKIRTRLIKSAMNLCEKHSIQGIDLDYTPRTTEQRNDYVIFLQEALNAWQAAGIKVSTTTIFHPTTRLLPQLYQRLDRIHLMAYDMIARGDGVDMQDKYHASLEKVQQTLAALLQPGGGLEDTPQKVVLGIPAYARHLTDPRKVATFAEIYDGVLAEKGASEVNWETLHSWQDFEWESGERIRAKVELARKLHLGGIFFWEIGQDKVNSDHPRGMLIETAAAAIRNETKILDGDGPSASDEL
ncbi:MAG: hypothetical protein SGARI_004418 [Bacillariaceae sp.]